MPRATKTLVLLFSLLLLLAGSAFADTADFQIMVPNPTPGLGTNYPAGTLFATVHLSLVSGAIQATVTMEPTFKIFDAFGFNGIAGLTVTNLTSGWTSSGGSGQLDGFGTFAYVLNGPNPQGALDSISFTVNCPGGCSSVNQMVAVATGGAAGQQGAHFAMHVYPVNFPTATGFAGDAPVPEPASLALLGMGLAGLGGWFRKRKS